jgi:hypothetical protein
MGIVFHTTYHGSSMSSLQTHFDVDIGRLRPSKNVWYRENKFSDVTGAARLSKAENDRLSGILTQAGQLFRQIPASLLNEIAANETYRIPIMTYYNQKVRAGEHMKASHVQEIIKFVSDKYDKQIGEAKMPATKAKRTAEKKMVVGWYRRNAANLKLIFQLQNLFIDAKTMLIRKFNQVNDIGTFLHTPDGGYRVTAPEGYVGCLSVDGQAWKLVDRMEFSRSNFLAQKSWKPK